MPGKVSRTRAVTWRPSDHVGNTLSVSVSGGGGRRRRPWRRCSGCRTASTRRRGCAARSGAHGTSSSTSRRRPPRTSKRVTATRATSRYVTSRFQNYGRSRRRCAGFLIPALHFDRQDARRKLFRVRNFEFSKPDARYVPRPSISAVDGGRNGGTDGLRDGCRAWSTTRRCCGI